MHKGHPCENIYPYEYFEEGITNGANWYNVPGMTTPFFVTIFFSFIGVCVEFVERKLNLETMSRQTIKHMFLFRWHARLELLKHQLF